MGTVLANGDVIPSYTGTFIRQVGENVGDYQINIGSLMLNDNYALNYVPAFLSITPLEVTIDYTGTTIQATGSGGTSANVLLVATITGILDQQISFNCVTFNLNYEIGGVANTIPVSGTSIVFGPNNEYARISANKTLNIGDNNFIIYHIDVIANCNYTGEDLNTPLTVYRPNGDMVTGGGYIIPDIVHPSAGTHPATLDEKANFGFNVKNKPTGIQGELNYKFESDNREWQLKATSFTSLGVVSYQDEGYKIAEYSGIATLSTPKKGSEPAINIPDLTFIVTLTDNGEPGNNDKIGFTVWDENILVHSSWWMGYYTEERTIGGGNLVVHKGLMQTAEIKPLEIINESLTPPPHTVYPNPTSDKATFKFVPGADSKARLDIYTVSGLHVSTVYDAEVVAGKEYSIEYQPALRNNSMLIYRLILNEEVYTGKLLFQK